MLRPLSVWRELVVGTKVHCGFVYCRRDCVGILSSDTGLWTPVTQTDCYIDVKTIQPIRSHSVTGRWKWNGHKLNQEVREIRKVNTFRGVASSGIYYPCRKVRQGMRYVCQKPSVRMRERYERQKVRTRVPLIVILSSFMSYRCATSEKSMSFFGISLSLLLACRFSTKYWMSQTCIVCGKGMLFGLKCKNCK